jgi:hypothetical protein
MPDLKKLTAALTEIVGVETKRANALTEGMLVPINQSLQDIVGVDRDATSAFAQTSPELGSGMIANPLSPLQGDEAFFTYLLPGAIYQAHDGSTWEIEEYDFEGKVRISNPWYPRRQGVVSVQDIRRSIYAWIDPVHVPVPPPPAGVDYGILDVREVA